MQRSMQPSSCACAAAIGWDGMEWGGMLKKMSSAGRAADEIAFPVPFFASPPISGEGGSARTCQSTGRRTGAYPDIIRHLRSFICRRNGGVASYRWLRRGIREMGRQPRYSSHK